MAVTLLNLSQFDELFDALDSSQRTTINKYKCAISKESPHLSLFEERINWLKSLKIVNKNGKDVTNIVKCVSGWQLTLSAVVNLWPILNSSHNF